MKIFHIGWEMVRNFVSGMEDGLEKAIEELISKAILSKCKEGGSGERDG